MRALFVSGTSVGGAAKSTYELAEVLAARGHTVFTLMKVDEAQRSTKLHKRLLNLDVKVARSAAPRLAKRAVSTLRRRLWRSAL